MHPALLNIILGMPDVSHAAFLSEEWAPLVSRFRMVLDRIMEIPPPGKNKYLDITVHVMKLMSQAQKAFEQGMADMYPHYYVDNVEVVDRVLSEMEVMLYVIPPSA